jgi:hypothetical protein
MGPRQPRAGRPGAQPFRIIDAQAQISLFGKLKLESCARRGNCAGLLIRPAGGPRVHKGVAPSSPERHHLVTDIDALSAPADRRRRHGSGGAHNHGALLADCIFNGPIVFPARSSCVSRMGRRPGSRPRRGCETPPDHAVELEVPAVIDRRQPHRIRIGVAQSGGGLALVDMPGYGYAAAAKSKIAAWTALIDAYLAGRANLARVHVLLQVTVSPFHDTVEAAHAEP